MHVYSKVIFTKFTGTYSKVAVYRIVPLYMAILLCHKNRAHFGAIFVANIFATGPMLAGSYCLYRINAAIYITCLFNRTLMWGTPKQWKHLSHSPCLQMLISYLLYESPIAGQKLRKSLPRRGCALGCHSWLCLLKRCWESCFLLPWQPSLGTTALPGNYLLHFAMEEPRRGRDQFIVFPHLFLTISNETQQLSKIPANQKPVYF